MQIVCMQFAYYFTLGLCTLLLDTIFGYRPHLGQIFNPAALDITKNYSFTTHLANFGNIIFVIIANAFIVEKANKCLDFTLTIFIFHVAAVWIYNQKFPWSLEWWLTNAAIIFVTTILAEWTCMRIEQ